MLHCKLILKCIGNFIPYKNVKPRQVVLLIFVPNRSPKSCAPNCQHCWPILHGIERILPARFSTFLYVAEYVCRGSVLGQILKENFFNIWNWEAFHAVFEIGCRKGFRFFQWYSLCPTIEPTVFRRQPLRSPITFLAIYLLF